MPWDSNTHHLMPVEKTRTFRDSEKLSASNSLTITYKILKRRVFLKGGIPYVLKETLGLLFHENKLLHKKKWHIIWVVPLPGCQSPPGLHYIFCRGSQPKPSFDTVTGRLLQPNIQYPNGWWQSPSSFSLFLLSHPRHAALLETLCQPTSKLSEIWTIDVLKPT